MLIVPTCQKSDVNLVAWGEQADVEKDRLLERVCCMFLALLSDDECISTCIKCFYI